MRRWRDWSLTARIVTVSVMAAVLAALITGVASTALLHGQLVAELQQRGLHRAQATAKTLDTYLSDLSNRLAEVASVPQVINFLSQPGASFLRGEVEKQLTRLTTDSGYQAAVVTDRSGRVMAASDQRLLGSSFADNPVFIWAMGGLTSIDDPVYDASDQQMYIYLSAPVSITGPVVGTIIGRITLNRIDAIVRDDNNFTGQGEFGVLWNDSGIRLSQPSHQDLHLRPLTALPQDTFERLVVSSRFGPNTRQLLQPASPWPEAIERSQLLMHNRNASPHVRVPTPDSDCLQVSIVSLERKRWFYAIAIPETRANRALALQWQVWALVVIGAAAVTAAAAVPVARSISHSMAGPTMAPTTSQTTERPPTVLEEPKPQLEKETVPEATGPPPSQVSETTYQETSEMETLVTREASVSPQATETTTERPSEGPAPEATGPSRPVPPSGSAEQPSETSPAGAGAVPETMLPPKNLLTAPEHVHAPAIAPAPIKAELVAPPELLPLPASAAAGKGAGRAISEEATGPEPAVPTPPPATPPETPPTKEGLTAAPRATGQTGQPEKAGWGIPLARPPLGPLA